jgi:hypothetical protein
LLAFFTHLEFYLNLKEKLCSSLEFYVGDRSESSRVYHLIIGKGTRSSWIIRHYHKLQWPDGHLRYWIYHSEENSYRYITLSLAETLIEVYFSANESQTLRDDYSWATKILDAEYEYISASLDDDIKTCENNMYVEEQHQLKILLWKHEHLFSGLAWA